MIYLLKFQSLRKINEIYENRKKKIKYKYSKSKDINIKKNLTNNIPTEIIKIKKIQFKKL